MPASRRTLLWLRPDQADLARALIDRVGLEIVALATPPAWRANPASDALARAFPGAEPVGDLRHALTAQGLDLALFLTPDAPEPGAGPDASPMDDPEILKYCRTSGLTLATIEPAPASVIDWRSLHDANLLSHVRVLPLLAHTPIFADAGEALGEFGPVRTVAFAARAVQRAGSLGARLFDAMHLIHTLLGLPESIDATYVPHRQAPTTQRPAHTPPQSIRRLHGDLTANLRYAPGAAAASITLSSRAGHWFRGATLLSDHGCLRLDETGFQRFDTEGTLVDSSQTRTIEDQADVDAIASSLIRLLDPHKPAPPPIDLPPILAMCEAAVLSTHTAQSEPPAAILQMAGAG